jgi:3-hydroxybutyryl-CoA dehydratase
MTKYIAQLTWQDLREGMKQELKVRLTPELIDQFASCSGDVSPIHMSSEEGQKHGFKGRVVHGMLLGALLSRIVGCDLPGQFAVLLSSQLKFHRPCLEGDEVSVEASIKTLSEATKTATMSFRFLVENELRADGAALVKVQR